ncbi:triose-phosphate isomerase [Patescibacteria group bacterium]|nr:triose-phosphate isomerase [Patescibacteria group bacterium]
MKYEKIIIANWKMNLGFNQSIDTAKELHLLLEKNDIGDKKQVVICPSFLSIYDLSKVLSGSMIALGAQDVFYEAKGAFTGEVSSENLHQAGCQFVIVGHSERRAMGETDEEVGKKTRAVLQYDMTPIVCVGEKLDQRKKAQTEEVISNQVKKALSEVEPGQYFILAYEPVWAISTSGSGQTITASEAAKQIELIKNAIPNHLRDFDIIYGGSVNASTVKDFTKNFAGVLVGSASLEAKGFFELIKNS